MFSLVVKVSPSSDELELVDKTCMRCLSKKLSKKSIGEFLKAKEEQVTKAKEYELSTDIKQFLDFCRKRAEHKRVNDDLAIVNSILRERMRKQVSRQQAMVGVLEELIKRKQINHRERFLCFKIINDTIESICKLHSLIATNDTAAKLKRLSGEESVVLFDEIRAHYSRLLPYERSKDNQHIFSSEECTIGSRKPLSTAETEAEAANQLGKRLPRANLEYTYGYYDTGIAVPPDHYDDDCMLMPD